MLSTLGIKTLLINTYILVEFLVVVIKQNQIYLLFTWLFFPLTKRNSWIAERLWLLCLENGGSAAGLAVLLPVPWQEWAAWVVKAPFLYLWSLLEAQRKKRQPKAFTINHICVWCSIYVVSTVSYGFRGCARAPRCRVITALSWLLDDLLQLVAASN